MELRLAYGKFLIKMVINNILILDKKELELDAMMVHFQVLPVEAHARGMVELLNGYMKIEDFLSVGQENMNQFKKDCNEQKRNLKTS